MCYLPIVSSNNTNKNKKSNDLDIVFPGLFSFSDLIQKGLNIGHIERSHLSYPGK